MNRPLTREEAQRQIAELQRHIDSLPTNNRPSELKLGMLFKHTSGYKYVYSQVGGDKFVLVNIETFNRFNEYNVFAGEEDNFTYLGHANDLITLKTDKPEVVVTDEIAEKAYDAFYTHPGGESAMKHVLTLAINGKL